MTHISNTDLLFQPLVLGDADVIKLLIEYRYKYDNNYASGVNTNMAAEANAVHQEVIATYVSLDQTIKSLKLDEQSSSILKMKEEGYTKVEIANTKKITSAKVARILESTYRKIFSANERQWRKLIYTNVLGLKTATCNSCAEELPATDEFFKHNKTKNIYESVCKKCKSNQ